MNKIKKNILYAIVLISIVSILMPNISAEPTILELLHSPSNPEILSKVTFTAEITGDDITDVYLFIQECEENGVCFQPPHNISLSLIDTNTYSGEVTLDKEKAEVMKYNLIIQDNGVWYDYIQTDLRTVDLVLLSNGNQNGGNGNNDSPGFVFILALISISLIVLFFKRKRF